MTACHNRLVRTGIYSLLLLTLIAGSCNSQQPPAPKATSPDAPVPAKAAAMPTPAATATPAEVAAVQGQDHPCAGGGRWFPADPEKLGRLVDTYLLGDVPPIARPPVALIVPHAGYQFSGPIAGKAYATLKGRTYKRVILLGLSHQVPLRGASLVKYASYETPLGKIPVDLEACDALLKCPVVSQVPVAHRTEHSVENQLPMLQRVVGSFKMVELLVGEMTDAERTSLADAVRPLVDSDTLIVASSDFTHYGPNYGYVPFRDRVPENLTALNNLATMTILQGDAGGWDAYLAKTGDTVCGRAGIGLLLRILEPWDDARGGRVASESSGHETGDYTNSVTYTSIAFWRDAGGLTSAEQAALLKLARDTVTEFLKTGQPPKLDPAKYDLTSALKAPGAAFVTLKNAGQLRGCIGHIVAVGPLVDSIVSNACNACRDPRFTDHPITEKEVPALSIEISVLSPMRRFHDFAQIKLGRDGLVMGRGQNRGVFLPQVPGEQGWNLSQYLENLCYKAGLPVDALKDPQTEFYKFSAQVFGEEKEKAPAAAGAKPAEKEKAAAK